MRNLLEPIELVQSFIDYPPENFTSEVYPLAMSPLYTFSTRLDLATTLDEKFKRYFQKVQKLLPGLYQRFLQPMVFFIGTPVSEYSFFPEGVDIPTLIKSMMPIIKADKHIATILKDMPVLSPLLSDSENQDSTALIAALENEGAIVISGQALAYVPIDFTDREEYITRFSSKRRADFRRKIKSFSHVSVETLYTGDDYFTHEDNLNCLYQLYLNVFENSYIHFDKLTFEFFKSVFQNSANRGVIFLYRCDQKLIGFNISFVYRQNLVEKYVGFLYPDSRENNLYYLGWFTKLDYCLAHHLNNMIIGWTNPEIKAYLGANFTQTYHAVYIQNRFLRWVIQKVKFMFESDRRTMEGLADN